MASDKTGCLFGRKLASPGAVASPTSQNEVVSATEYQAVQSRVGDLGHVDIAIEG
jgi:hypothetical protein